MKTYFISSLFPNELKDELLNKSIGATANANNAFQWALFHGLRKYYPNLYLLNFPNVGAYPSKFKNIRVNGSLIKEDSIVIGESYSFINLIQLKHHLKYTSLCNTLNKILIKESDDEFIFFIYDLYPPFLKAINKLKEENSKKKIHVCLIVPDLHGLTGSSNILVNRIFLKKDSYSLSKSYKAIDFFVFLTQFMADMMPVKNKPWVCVEGIFDPSVNYNNCNFENSIIDNKKTIFYSGAVDERNGIINLLKAFKKIKSDDYKLLICGEGSLSNLVTDYSKKDPRITYLGQVSREKVLSLQNKSTLLINPRLPDQNFTKYSFPSKTMEYFASGTPTLMYNLEGVPQEYHNYCFIQNDTSIDSLYNRILEICNMDIDYLNNFGQKARDFILENKNPEIQCLSIYNMIKE